MGRDVPFAFNRKESKDHGEGGSIIGAPLEGRVLVIDAVMTAGTAVREAAAILEEHEAQIAGVAISPDRMERGARQSVVGGKRVSVHVAFGGGRPLKKKKK